MNKTAKTLTLLALSTTCLTAQVTIQDFQFDDANDTRLSLTTNDAAGGVSWDFRLGNPDRGLTFDGNFVIGDDGAGGASSIAIDSDFTRKLDFTSTPLTSGQYSFEFRLPGWDLSNGPVPSNGIKLRVGDGANWADLVFNMVNAADDVRVRTAAVGTVTGTAKQNTLGSVGLDNSLSPDGVTVRLDGDLSSGAWATSFALDSAGGTFTDLTTDGASLTKIDKIYLVIEGTTAWGSGDHIQLDYATLTGVPEPATVALFLGFAALGLVLYRRRR